MTATLQPPKARLTISEMKVPSQRFRTAIRHENSDTLHGQEDAHASGFELLMVDPVVAVPVDMRPDPVPVPAVPLSVLEDAEPLDPDPPELHEPPCLPPARPGALPPPGASNASPAWERPRRRSRLFAQQQGACSRAAGMRPGGTSRLLGCYARGTHSGSC